ncbi:MAG: glycoside hydrolase family 31 protein [Anaerolineae bacterium]
MADETKDRKQAFLERVRFRGQPAANPESMVVRNQVRFTLLTPRLIRLEWSETGIFEDRGTFAFPTRHAPAPAFRLREVGPALVLDTGPLRLRYEGEGRAPLDAENLSITFTLGGQARTWRPGLEDRHNLRGTRRTLDRCPGDAALEEGLLSRAGWTLFDDTATVRFDPGNGWVRPHPEHALQDWYFFGYGHDYKAALADYVRFGGEVPLIPRYVLGAWWSRYWAYSDDDLRALVADFEEHDLPLDILVVDMDWHTPDSWTGYTWNRELFPDPPAFLRWAHSKGLRVTLNLHPAEGVQPFEEVYPDFARAMGHDPASGEAVPFRIGDPAFARHYFELLHHPREEEGVDFWWIDWQQGERSEVTGLDPLPWLNHLHFHDSARRGLRPLIYSRWGGLGNHRYQTGFSGDTYVGWPALQFQPYFTATASNVLYGWWGHDIGGHMGDATEPELFARWVQFGALSPALRLHATKDPKAERRPWKYPPEVYEASRRAFHWRYRLLPYIYTMARVAHDTGLSLCRPLYYEYPEEEAAYAARYQYFFGDQMIAAPIVHPADPETGLAAADVWVPPGTWIEYTSRETWTGPRWVRIVGGLERVPMLVREGAILPLAPSPRPDKHAGMALSASHLASGTTDSIPPHRLVLSVFPGSGRFRLYEDDGLTEGYRRGQFEWTEIETGLEGEDTWTVSVAPVEGHCAALPPARAYEIRLEGSCRPDEILLNGAAWTNWTYDEEALVTLIHTPRLEKGRPLLVTARAAGSISALGQARNREVARADVRRLLGDPEREPSLDALLRDRPPGWVDALARLGGPFVHFVEFTTPEEAARTLGRLLVAAPAAGEESYDLEVVWTFYREGQARHHRVARQGLAGPQILDAPFAFEGQVAAARWTAEVGVTWRGRRLTWQHQSALLFPSIYAWRVLTEDGGPLALEEVLSGANLPWQVQAQTTDDLININQPFGAVLAHSSLEQRVPETATGAYLATTVVSPRARDVVLRFRTGGPARFYLNGREVSEVPVAPEPWLPAVLRRARQTEVVRLEAGRNHLLVHTPRPQGARPWWYFGGAFTTPHGQVVDDLRFEV